MNLLWGGLVFPFGLALALDNSVVLVSCCFLVGGVPVEGVDVLLFPRLFVAEKDPGSDDCEDENGAGDDDDDVHPGSLLVGL